MSGLHFLIAVAAKVFLLAALAGIVRHGYHRRCLTFVAYVLAILVLGSLITFWPARFWNWPFWNFSQSIYGVLKFAVAVELAVRSLAPFPGTWRVARGITGTVLLLTTAMWCLTSTPKEGIAFVGHSVLSTGTIWLFAVTAAIAFCSVCPSIIGIAHC